MRWPESKYHQDPPEILCPFFCCPVRSGRAWMLVCALFPKGCGGEFWRQGELGRLCVRRVGLEAGELCRGLEAVELCRGVLRSVEAGLRGLVACGGGAGGAMAGRGGAGRGLCSAAALPATGLDAGGA